MIVTTTPAGEGRAITEYKGLVGGKGSAPVANASGTGIALSQG